jgi:hypothetical protein
MDVSEMRQAAKTHLSCALEELASESSSHALEQTRQAALWSVGAEICGRLDRLGDIGTEICKLLRDERANK